MSVLANGASNAVLRGDGVYRIRRQLQSPGDIFELDVSPLALYVGPQSDIAEIEAIYHDPDSPNALGSLIISPGGPWVERLESDPVKISNGLPATIKIAAADIVNNSWERPAVSPQIPTRRFFVPAEIDVIAALSASQIGSVPAVRADKTYRFPNVPFATSGVFPANGSTDLTIPVYGRRFVSIQMVAGPFTGFTVQIYLTSLQPGANTQGKFLGSISQASISVETINSLVVRMGNDVDFYTDSAGPSTIAPSPDVAGGPIGQADLLTINLADNGSPSDRSVDFFIKVSDREEG